MPDTLAYALTFTPIFKERIWGGRRLQERFGKALPPGPIGESWELSDLPADNSIVDRGPWAGRRLADCLAQAGPAITGWPGFTGPLALLVKLLDAQDILSVQVHPDEATCRRLGRGEPKTECWVILDAEPGAFIYKGLQPGTTRSDLAQAIADGTVESLLRKVPVRPGECHFLPSGTVHAIGPGLLIAEIQQPSDTTYRVYDYNRTDAQGRRRELHIQEALESIHFDGSDRDLPVTTGGRLVNCPYFTLDHRHLSAGQTWTGDDRPAVLMTLRGSSHLADPVAATELPAGRCVLVPAHWTGRLETTEAVEFLEVRLPDPKAMGERP